MLSKPYEDQKEVDPKAAALIHSIVFGVHNRGPSAVDGLILQISVPWRIDTVNVLNVGYRTQISDIILLSFFFAIFPDNACFGKAVLIFFKMLILYHRKYFFHQTFEFLLQLKTSFPFHFIKIFIFFFSFLKNVNFDEKICKDGAVVTGPNDVQKLNQNELAIVRKYFKQNCLYGISF